MRNGLRNRNQIAVLTPLIFADSDTVHRRHIRRGRVPRAELLDSAVQAGYVKGRHDRQARREPAIPDVLEPFVHVDDVDVTSPGPGQSHREVAIDACPALPRVFAQVITERSEEHTSELQSLMRISYAVFCLKKKKNNHTHN